MLLLLLGVLSLLVNSFLNLYLLNRFYPDKVVSKKMDRLSLILFCVNIIYWFLFSLGLIITLVDFKKERSLYQNTGFIIGMAIMCLIAIFQIVVLVLQLKLPGTIVRNNRQQMSLLIDSIGQT